MEEQLQDSLLLKFTELFNNLKSLREQRQQVEEENEHYISLIEEEAEQQEPQSVDSDPEELLQQVQQRHRMLIEQKKESDWQLKEENNLKNQLYAHIEGIQQEIVQMNNDSEQQKETEADLQQRIEETARRIDEYQGKQAKAKGVLEQQEQQIAAQIEKNYADNEKLREVQQEVRNCLQSNSQADKRIVDLEKSIAKLWDELNKKTQRIQVLQNNQHIMQSKIQKSEKSESIYHKIKDDNTALAQENIQIREKLNQLINAIPQSMRSSKLGKKKGSKEFLDMYDDNICQNQMKLRNLDKVKNEHSKNVQNLMNEISNLEDKYNQMTSNIKTLQEQYYQLEHNLSSKFDEDEYARTNCPNYYKIKKGK